MKRTFFKKLNNEKGLTLVELLAVIIILGIVAAIAIPATGKMIENSRIKAEKADALIMMSAARLYFVETPRQYEIDAVGLQTLLEQGYITDTGYLNNSYWVANDKPAWICGEPIYGDNRVEFKKATVEEINDSKNELVVGTGTCPKE